jgi:hypothetical protein
MRKIKGEERVKNRTYCEPEPGGYSIPTVFVLIVLLFIHPRAKKRSLGGISDLNEMISASD